MRLIVVSVVAAGLMSGQAYYRPGENACPKLNERPWAETLDQLRRLLLSLPKDLSQSSGTNGMTAPVAIEFEGEAEPVLQAVRAAGGRRASVNSGTIYTALALEQWDAIARLPGVRTVRPQASFDLQQAPSPSACSGSDEAFQTQSRAIRKLLESGITGKGVRIGVIDVSFPGIKLDDNVKAMQKFESTPGSIAASEKRWGPGHGAAMANLIRYIATESQLYLANVGGLEQDIMAAADWLRAHDVHIINYSGGSHFFGAKDGNSPVDRKVDALSPHLLWVNSAGNDAQKHWAGLLEPFQPLPPIPFWMYLFRRSFGADAAKPAYLCVTPSSEGKVEVQIALSQHAQGAPSSRFCAAAFDFADPGASKIDCKTINSSWTNGAVLELETKPGQEVALFGVPDTPTTPPIVNGRVVNYVHRGPSAHTLWPLEPKDSILIPATASSALAVGALCEDGRHASYSSNGPIGSGTSNRYPIQVKPDVSAYTGFGQRRLSGTSAAAPHVTGLAALAIQASGFRLKGPKLREAIRAKYLRPAPGNDLDAYGFGIIDASKIPIPEPTRVSSISLPPELGGSISTRLLDRLPSTEAGDADVKLALGRSGGLPEYRIGDGMKLGFRPDRDLHFALLHRDSAGRYTLIAPASGAPSLAPAGERRIFPEDGTTMTVSGPAGEDEFILICSPQPVDLSNLDSLDSAPGLIIRRARFRIIE